MPEGLVLDVATGAISGVPFESGTFDVSFQANDAQAVPDTAVGTFTVTITAADSDGDGLADGWETKYFGDLSAGAADDGDGDGYINIAEAASNTNPTVAETIPPYIAGAEWTNVGLGGGGALYSPIIAPGDAGLMFANMRHGRFLQVDRRRASLRDGGRCGRQHGDVVQPGGVQGGLCAE